MQRLRFLLALSVLVALAPAKVPETPKRRGGESDQTIRVLLNGTAATARISSPEGFVLVDRGNALAARAERNEGWRVERGGGRVRAIRPDGVPTVWKDALRARPNGDGLLSVAEALKLKTEK